MTDALFMEELSECLCGHAVSQEEQGRSFLAGYTYKWVGKSTS